MKKIKITTGRLNSYKLGQEIKIDKLRDEKGEYKVLYTLIGNGEAILIDEEAEKREVEAKAKEEAIKAEAEKVSKKQTKNKRRK